MCFSNGGTVAIVPRLIFEIVLVVNTFAVRYSLMPCDVPVGDVKLTQTLPTADDCGDACSAANWTGLTYDSTSGNCNCVNVTGYGAPVGSESGYVAVNATVTTCPSCTETQQIVHDLVFQNQTCPPGFFVWQTTECANNYKLTQAQCQNYSPWFKRYNATYSACVTTQA